MSIVFLSIGIGNSGVDIAVDLSHTASQVSVRNSFFSMDFNLRLTLRILYLFGYYGN